MVVDPWPPLVEQLVHGAMIGVLVWSAFLLVRGCLSGARRRRRP